MDYGSVIWQGGKQVNRLSSIQRKALCLCLGLPGTAGTETVEVAAGIPPLDLCDGVESDINRYANYKPGSLW